jgi:hypothetical protein
MAGMSVSFQTVLTCAHFWSVAGAPPPAAAASSFFLLTFGAGGIRRICGSACVTVSTVVSASGLEVFFRASRPDEFHGLSAWQFKQVAFVGILAGNDNRSGDFNFH